MIEKKALRQYMKEQLNLLSKPIYEDHSYKIAQLLYNQEEWTNARIIGITISNYPEVDTYQIIRKAWEEGKQVTVVRCIPKEKGLIFRKLDRFSQLESTFFGLYEPKITETSEASLDEIDLLIVPGLIFSLEGFRIGFGGGYYDRLLSNYKGKTISLAFEIQLMKHLPVEEHDQAVQKIITNEEVIVCDC